VSVYGDENRLLDRGGIEVRAVPVDSGARISIDNEPYGKIPARVVGALVPGPHNLHIDSPSYEVVDQKFIVLPGKVETIVLALVPAYGVVRVDVTPEDSEVRVNGKVLMRKDLAGYRVRAGEIFRVEVSAPGYFGLSIEGQVDRDGRWERAVTLESKIKLREPAEVTPNPLLGPASGEASDSLDYWRYRMVSFFVYGDVGGIPAKTGVDGQIAYSGGGGVRFRPFYFIGFEAALGAGTIYEDPNASRTAAAVTGNYQEMKYGIPLFFGRPGESAWGSVWSLTPEMIRYRTDYTVSDKSRPRRNGHAAYKAYGVRLGWETVKKAKSFGDWGGGFGIDLSYDRSEFGGPAVGKFALKVLFGP
jgi:hypothetical protein